MAMQSVMSGQAAVAVIISIIQLITVAVNTDKETIIGAHDQRPTARDTSATVFFFVVSLILGLSIFAHRYLVQLPTYHNVVVHFEARKAETTEEEEGLLATSVGSLREVEPALAVNIIEVTKKNSTYNVTVLWVFLITLSLFPAITSSVTSVNGSSPSLLSSPAVFSAVHFLIFNSGDWFGRWACSIPRLQIWSRKRLGFLSLLRTVFIPLILACNVSRDLPSLSTPQQEEGSLPFLNSDQVFFIILFVFGFSNGHIGSLSMMAASSLQHNKRLRKEEVDTAAVISSFSLAIGLVLGSLVNFAIRGIMCQCNPFLH